MENLPTYRLTQSGPEAQEILDQVNLNTIDIEQLKRLYQALTQSEPEIIEPTDTWPVANPEENVIYRVIDRVHTPPQYYSDYMWNGTSMVPMAQYNNAIDNEPTANSNNLVKSGGVYSFVHANGGAYDISAAHAVGGVLATYDDLADALGTNGANVPAAVRKGGMSIKFVLSSDNKYVRYNYLLSSTTNANIANVNNWQGVDDEPTSGSNNLVKSGGVEKVLGKYSSEIIGQILTNFAFSQGVYNYNGGLNTSASEAYHYDLDISSFRGKYIDIRTCVWNVGYCLIFDENRDIIDRLQLSHEPTSKTECYIRGYLVPDNANILGISNFTPQLGKLNNDEVIVLIENSAGFLENKEDIEELSGLVAENAQDITNLSSRVDDNETTLIGMCEKIIPNNWSLGYYNINGVILTNVNAGFHATISLSQYAGEKLAIRTCAYGAGYCVFFDSNGDFIEGSAVRIGAEKPLSKDKCYIKNITIPNNAVNLGITNFIPDLGLLQNSEVFISVIYSDSELREQVEQIDAKVDTNLDLFTNFALKSGQDNLLPFIGMSADLVKGYYIDSQGTPQRLNSAGYIYIPIPANVDSLYFETFTSNYWQVGALFNYVNGVYEFVADLGSIKMSGTKNFSNYISQATHIGINVNNSWIYTESVFDGMYRTIRFLKSEGSNVQTTDDLGNSSSLAASQKLVTNLYKESRTYGHCLNKPFDLQNKAFTFFGDSITWGYSSTPHAQIEDCWAKLFTEHFGSTEDNRAVSTTKICDVNNSPNSITNKILNYNGTPDFIFIHGGTNDYGTQTPLGEYGDLDYTTFYGSMELICQHLSGSNFVNTTIIFITPINRSDGPVSTEIYTLNQYRNAMWEIAAKYGFNIIDGSVLGFPNRREASSVIKTLLLTDGLHPSNIGHSFMAKCIAGILD